LIVYYSNVSGYTARFVEKLDEPALRIPLKTADAAEFTVDEEFVLIVPTYGANGKDFVPKQVIKFLNNINNRTLMRGVIASGSLNFLEDFAKSGRIISEKCQVPLLYTFELAGMDDDVKNVKEGLKNFWETK
jgi:protein involved in ribonucleotide reduction